ncbi:hypothetical protein LTS18_002252, partial [Coniosporium uncinatum]
MASSSIQDRTTEFRSILQQAQRRQNASKVGAQRQSLLTASEKAAANGPSRKERSQFARQAADVGRSISGTMAKLERLAELARRRSPFDDQSGDINQLTFVIKQDLASLTQSISSLSALNTQQHPRASQPGSDDQEGKHNMHVVNMLKGSLESIGKDFRDVLEVRTKNIQASRARQENFISSIAPHTNPHSLDPSRTDSPLYQTPSGSRGRSPAPPQGYKQTSAAQQDILSLDPGSSGGSSGSSALARTAPATDQQLLLMEEAAPQNTYIQQRGEAIETIERTITELGSIFGQLAQMVSEQGEMIQRIDANTEDVVENVQGAQRELMKYWGRVQGNRWL